MQSFKGFLVGAGAFLLTSHALAWSDHASLLWPMVREMPEVRDRIVTVETLESFLAAEASGLEILLAEHEEDSRQRLDHYPPRPRALAFRAKAPDLRAAFLAALRINPTLPYLPYRQLTVEDNAVDAPMNWRALSFLDSGPSQVRVSYQPLIPGEGVSAAHVVASGSDEPDFGMDIGLFENSGTSFGASYGFGVQPFGNPNLVYGSQAPFHMGFFHLDILMRKLQPDLLRTYPHWRVSLFGALAQFAFESGHDYWGWRFAGWALHYIGDLSQPYHAQPLPGVGTLDALLLLVRGRTSQAVQLVSNRHGVIESYQYERMWQHLRDGQWRSPLLDAIARARPVPVWRADTLIGHLARDSVAAGAALDAGLEHHVVPRFVSDPGFEWIGSGEESGIVMSIREAKGEQAVAALDELLIIQLERFSRFARSWIERFTVAQPN